MIEYEHELELKILCCLFQVDALFFLVIKHTSFPVVTCSFQMVKEKVWAPHCVQTEPNYDRIYTCTCKVIRTCIYIYMYIHVLYYSVYSVYTSITYDARVPPAKCWDYVDIPVRQGHA